MYALGTANKEKTPISPQLDEADSLIAKEDFSGAVRVLLATHKQIDGLEITADEKAKLRTTIAEKLSKTGQDLHQKKKLTEALETLASAQKIFIAIIGTQPSSKLKLAMATNLDRLTSVSVQSSKLDNALSYTREAISTREQVLIDDPKNAGCECEIAVNYEFLSLVLEAKRDRDGSLKAQETALTIRRKMAKAEPMEQRWQRALAQNLLRTSLLQLANGHPDALSNAKEAVALRRSFAEKDGQSVQLADELIDALKNAASVADDVHEYKEAVSFQQEQITLLRHLIKRGENRRDKLISALGRLSWYGLFAGEPQVALATASEALQIDPSQMWIETNFAHAKMFLGDAEEAMRVYLRNKGEKFAQGQWNDVIRDDFKQLQKAGRHHPMMQDVIVALENSDTERSAQQQKKGK